MQSNVSVVSISQALKGANFPANNKDLEKQAQKNNAAENVIDAIRNLPNQKFQSIAEVERAFGQDQKAAS